MHVDVTRGDERHAELRARGSPFLKQAPVVAAVEELRREPNSAVESLAQPAAAREQRGAVGVVLVGNPKQRAPRIREAFDEILAARPISAFRRRAPRAADQPAERGIGSPVDGEHDDFEPDSAIET